MKQVDFGVECPECGNALHIPLKMEDDVLVTDGSNFLCDCANCLAEFRVKVQLTMHVENERNLLLS